MARRKKEPEGYHQMQIAKAAEQLFLSQGVASTSMDEIAKKAGYSKATLYVYFQHKEELIDYLINQSMKLLHTHIQKAIAAHQTTYDIFTVICYELVDYQQTYPFYFTMVQQKIELDHLEDQLLQQDTFAIGEAINQSIAQVLRQGIQQKELSCEMELIPMVFLLWGSLAGIIQLADSKEAYMLQELHISKDQFLKQSFDFLYQAMTGGIKHA